jgi:hypothetical protein
MNKLIRIDFPDFAFTECVNHQLSPRTSDRLDKFTYKPLLEQTMFLSNEDPTATDNQILPSDNDENKTGLFRSVDSSDYNAAMSSSRSAYHTPRSGHSTPRSIYSTPRSANSTPRLSPHDNQCSANNTQMSSPRGTQTSPLRSRGDFSNL